MAAGGAVIGNAADLIAEDHFKVCQQCRPSGPAIAADVAEDGATPLQRRCRQRPARLAFEGCGIADRQCNQIKRLARICPPPRSGGGGSRRFALEIGFPLPQGGKAVHHGAMIEGALRGRGVLRLAGPGLLRRCLQGAAIGEGNAPRHLAEFVDCIKMRGRFFVGLAAGQKRDAGHRGRHAVLEQARSFPRLRRPKRAWLISSQAPPY
jgi:hypothetical protein